MKCMACGNASLVKGTVRGGDGGAKVRFYPSDGSLLRQLLFSSGTREVQAYGCLHCKNLQFAVDFTESDLARYQQFEGEQPDVLGINSNPKNLED
jgi:hypothetical protein